MSSRQDMERAGKDRLVVLVFSKDRAMQLAATLESFMLHCRDGGDAKVHVLYKASNDVFESHYEKLKKDFPSVMFIEESDFKEQVLRVLDGYEYVLFLVDDNIFVGDFSCGRIIRMLGLRPEVLGFSLRLGRNTEYCYMRDVKQSLPAFNSAGEGVLEYDWRRGEHDFGYPLEVSSSVYRVEDVFGLLRQVDFANPNIMEGMMAANASLYVLHRPGLLCYERSVTFCNPVNVVQSVSDNRASSECGYTAERLAEMFEKGMRIDVGRYSNFTPRSCHQEVEPAFKGGGGVKDGDVLVSVEMVAYNAVGCIGRAIESVLSQTYRNLELLIVDDGSTDGTGAVVKQYDDSRIRYIHQSHRNAASARNRAIREAKGEYILCVDSDDFMLSDYLEGLLRCAEREPEIDFFYPSALVLVDGEGNSSGQKWEYLDFSDNRELPAFLFANGFSPIPNPGSLIRRSLFDRVGLYEDLETVEDFVFLCRNALKIKFKRASKHSNYYYRRAGGGLSHRFEARNKITAEVLSEMVSTYRPEVLFPQLAGVSETQMRQQYYKYVMMTFNRLAEANRGRFGEYFQWYADFYKAELLKGLVKSDRTDVREGGCNKQRSLADVNAVK
jgi:glycosyltransferase involved in cell wall biosynthesis